MSGAILTGQAYVFDAPVKTIHCGRRGEWRFPRSAFRRPLIVQRTIPLFSAHGGDWLADVDVEDNELGVFIRKPICGDHERLAQLVAAARGLSLELELNVDSPASRRARILRVLHVALGNNPASPGTWIRIERC